MRAWVLRLLLVAGLVALVLWDGALLRQRAQARDAGQRIGALIPVEQQQSMRVAAVSLARGDRQHTYARVGGVWRCLDWRNAVADGAAVTGLVDALLAAEGLVQSDDPLRAADYGLGTPATWTVGLHGQDLLQRADRDLLFSAHVGASVPFLDGSYVQRAGETAVWAIDTDPRALIDASVRPGRPALLDDHVIPLAWPAPGQRIVRVVLDRAGGDGYAIELRAVAADEGGGASAVRWVLVQADGTELALHPILAVSYLSFLKLATLTDVLDPDRAAAHGLSSPETRLSLETNGGDALQLLFGAADDEGRVAVSNTNLGTLVEVSADVASLLRPEPQALVDPTMGNPWQPWLEGLAEGIGRER